MSRLSASNPWLNRRIWQEGLYGNNTFSSFVFMLGAWLLAILVAGYLIYAMGSTLFAGDVDLTMGNLAFGLLVFVGLPALIFYFLIHVLNAWRRWQMWRNCQFEHFSIPAFLGAQLEGKLMLPGQLKAGDTLSYSLGCFRQRRYQRERVGKKGVSLWESEAVNNTIVPGMKSISISIDLPKSRPESNWSGRFGHVKWLLSIKTANDKFEDIDYEVPVFFNPYDRDLNPD